MYFCRNPQILLQEENPGITYEYTVPFRPNDTTHDVSKYIWKHTEWTECSKSCGKGNSFDIFSAKTYQFWLSNY